MDANPTYIINLLKKHYIIDEDQVNMIFSLKEAKEDFNINNLLSNKIISDSDIAKALAKESHLEYVNLSEFEVDQSLSLHLPSISSLRYKVVPISFSNNCLTIAVEDPLDFDSLDSVRHLLQEEPIFVVASKSDIKNHQIKIYSSEIGSSENSTNDNSEKKIAVSKPIELSNQIDPLDDSDAPIIRMVQEIFKDAFLKKASDIHIEPVQNEIRIRYRIDGALNTMQKHPISLLASIVSRIKIMTGTMSISEKRLPQDGRIQKKFDSIDIDMRVSTIPTSDGESIVMRILDKRSLSIGLSKMGFLSDDEKKFNELISFPDGMNLITGPTGSGKTTTLYASLNAINRPNKKIITVEDPVEYLLSGINQVQVKEKIGMTFASALRAILRQAPNIIMIGEIRDSETASIAINSSLTGHLVFSTLHTNNAPSAVSRLLDIGVKNFLIASAIRSITAQRLVRKICEDCKTDDTLTPGQLKTLRLDKTQNLEINIKKGTGCENCRNIGYKGRMGLFEIFKLNDPIKELINKGSSTSELFKIAKESGMRTLREDGIKKTLMGSTTISEILRVTMND